MADAAVKYDPWALTIVQAAPRETGAEDVVLFDHRAHGDYREYSDADLPLSCLALWKERQRQSAKRRDHRK